MCGVIGVSLTDVNKSDIELVRKVFQQTMVRGKHATGVSYVKDEEVHTDKQGIPVTEFFETRNIEDWVNEDGGLYLIGHIRYSTSDLRYNQPFDNGSLAIAHNGVISQEDPSTWEYECETANDSELLLRAFEDNKHPLEKYYDRSMSVVKLTSDKTLTAFRNHERPLWMSKLGNGVIFTSTKDIAKRSGLTLTKKCDMFIEYRQPPMPSHSQIESFYNISVENNIIDLQ